MISVDEAGAVGGPSQVILRPPPLPHRQVFWAGPSGIGRVPFQTLTHHVWGNMAPLWLVGSNQVILLDEAPGKDVFFFFLPGREESLLLVMPCALSPYRFLSPGRQT